jgi:hypothetical protein
MLAAAGRMVQYANEEFRRLKNHEQVEPGVSNESAFARAKQNRIDAYTEIHRIYALSQELREVYLQLMAEEQAKEQNTTVANALKAIRCYVIGSMDPKLAQSMNYGRLTIQWISKILLGQQ